MAKITKQQEKMFSTAYDNHKYELLAEIEEWKERQISIMQDHDFRTFESDSDFLLFATESFIHNVSGYVTIESIKLKFKKS